MAGSTVKYLVVLLLLLVPVVVFVGYELDNRDINNGRILYKQQCASCHGTNLEGQPNWQRIGPDGIFPAPPHDASGHTWHHDTRFLFDYTKRGGKALLEARGVTVAKSGMPGFGNALADDEIHDILAYIRSTWPERIQNIQAGRNPGQKR